MPDDSPTKNGPLPTLDYAGPVSQPSLVRVVLSGLFGIFMGLIAAIFLLVGFATAFDAFFGDNSGTDRGAILLGAMVLIGFGWLSAHLYLRWRRATFGRK